MKEMITDFSCLMLVLMIILKIAVQEMDYDTCILMGVIDHRSTSLSRKKNSFSQQSTHLPWNLTHLSKGYMPIIMNNPNLPTEDIQPIGEVSQKS